MPRHFRGQHLCCAPAAGMVVARPGPKNTHPVPGAWRKPIARCEVCGRRVKQPSRSIINGRIICSMHNPRPDQRAHRREERSRRPEFDRPEGIVSSQPGPVPVRVDGPAQAIALAAEPAVEAAVAAPAVEAAVAAPAVEAVVAVEPAVEAVVAAPDVEAIVAALAVEAAVEAPTVESVTSAPQGEPPLTESAVAAEGRDEDGLEAPPLPASVATAEEVVASLPATEEQDPASPGAEEPAAQEKPAPVRPSRTRRAATAVAEESSAQGKES